MSVFKNLKFIVFLLTTLLLPLGYASAVNTSFAENSGLKKTGQAMNFSSSDIDGTNTLETAVGKYIRIMLSFLGVLFLIFVIYAGYLWMTAQGSQSDVDRAKKIFTAAVMGFLIVASAYSLTILVYESIDTTPSEDVSGSQNLTTEDPGDVCSSEQRSAGAQVMQGDDGSFYCQESVSEDVSSQQCNACLDKCVEIAPGMSPADCYMCYGTGNPCN